MLHPAARYARLTDVHRWVTSTSPPRLDEPAGEPSNTCAGRWCASPVKAGTVAVVATARASITEMELSCVLQALAAVDFTPPDALAELACSTDPDVADAAFANPHLPLGDVPTRIVAQRHPQRLCRPDADAAHDQLVGVLADDFSGTCDELWQLADQILSQRP